MLLDARGHLKLTDLGLCKKVGDVTPHEEPDAILEMLRRQTISGNGPEPSSGDSQEIGDGGTQPASEGYMTIEDATGIPTKRDEKTRREVRI
jgi:serine/threonine protein kinase